MFHVTLGDLDEIGDEVVTALQLNVDLSEGVFEAIAERDEAVVDAGEPEAEYDDEKEKDSEEDENKAHKW
jgi:hypothetical protein